MCGHGPAVDVVFRAHRGYVMMVRLVAEGGPYCRDCGLAMFRELTSVMMVHGWWSVVSPVVAPAVILLNLRARRAVLRLGGPGDRCPYVTPNMRPLPPGKPVLARPKSWLGLVLLATLVTAVGVAVARQQPTGPAPGCITLSETLRVQHARFVDCAQPHHARVVGVVAEWAACPAEATRHIEIGARIYCLVDETTR